MRSAANPSASPERRALSGVDDSAPATNSYWSSMREAMRWTAPMKAPSPPPTMPSLIFPPVLASLRPSMAMNPLPSLQSERALDLLLVDRGAGEVVKRLVGDADDVVLDELGALARAGVLDVERLDPLVVDVDEVEIIELLQHEVRRIVVDRAALVALNCVEEALERRPVEQIFARVKLIADVAARVVERVEDRPPPLSQFFEGRLDQPRRALWPRIDEWPRERAGEGRMRGEAEALRSLRAFQHMV